MTFKKQGGVRLGGSLLVPPLPSPLITRPPWTETEGEEGREFRVIQITVLSVPVVYSDL